MTLRPQSLRSRLLVSAALFIALALVATGVAVQFALHRFVQGQIDQRLDGQLLTLADALERRPDGTVALSRNVDGPPFDNPRTGWFWLIRTPTHTWVAAGLRSDAVSLGPIPPGPIAHPRPLEGFGPNGRRIRARVDHVDVGGIDVVTIAAAPLEALNGPLRDALSPLITSLLALGAGLVVATFLQVRVGLRPLAALRDALASVRTGTAERLPMDQPSEVRPLVAEMNSLLEQHDANLERARRHVANLAHALKTPLAGIALGLDAPGRDPDGKLRDLAAAMTRQIRHHLARARAAALGESTRSSTPLIPRVADHVAAFSKIYADKTVRCTIDVPPDLSAACDPQDLDEMVGNLLDNAFKWARAAVRVDAAGGSDRVRIGIEDDGPGVPADQIERILKPGQRLDEQVSGDGFGLAIVQELAGLYGGSVSLSRGHLGGMRTELVLPAR